MTYSDSDYFTVFNLSIFYLIIDCLVMLWGNMTKNTYYPLIFSIPLILFSIIALSGLALTCLLYFFLGTTEYFNIIPSLERFFGIKLYLKPGAKKRVEVQAKEAKRVESEETS